MGRVALVAVGVVLADAGTRAWFALTGDPYDGAAVRALATSAGGGGEVGADRPEGDLPWAAPGLGRPEPLRQHPFFGYDFPSRADSIERFEALRQTEHWKTLERTAEPFVIVVVGGSVSQGFTDLEVGGMDRFEARLMEDPRFEGRTVAVVGQGRSGFRQPQQVALVHWILGLGIEPDAVVNLDGFNEVAFGLANAEYDAHPLYPWFGYWSRVASEGTSGEVLERVFEIRLLDRDASDLASTVLELGAYRSCILGTLARLRLEDLARRRHALSAALLEDVDRSSPILGPRFADSEAAVMDLVVRGWFESSRSLHGMLAERGITYLHALQPTLHDPGSKPLTDEERENGPMPEVSVRGVELGYPRLREAGKELAALGVPFVDCSGVFRDVAETIYIDSCHFLGRGNELLADAIADALLAALPD